VGLVLGPESGACFRGRNPVALPYYHVIGTPVGLPSLRHSCIWVWLFTSPHPPVQQWSWLKTLIVYKLNPLRAASNQPTYLWVPVATGAEIHLDVAPAPAETTVAPPQPQPSRKRVADFTVDPATFRPVKTTWPNPRDSKASSSSSGAAVLGATAKTPGAPPPLD
jgi:hypothetical protein